MLLIVDAFNERKGTIHQRGPQARLVGEISRYLGSRIPSICFQTGMTKRVTFEVGSRGQLVGGMSRASCTSRLYNAAVCHTGVRGWG